jgi:hypothetical protein
MKVEKASHIMPDYKPVWLLQAQWIALSRWWVYISLLL